MTARHRPLPTRGLMRRRSCHEATPCTEEGCIVFEPVWTVIAIAVAPSGQPFGPKLVAPMAGSSPGRVSTCAPSFFPALRASNFQRES